jgi:hypothetical protein
MDFNRIWRSLAAGLCGSAAHFTLMFLKARAGLLPSFQPYEDLQHALGNLLGHSVHPWLTWLLSFLNGAVVLGLLFGRIYRFLPGRTGAVKGLTFGLLGWALMGLIFFPLLGRGLFAIDAGLGLRPALFSLLMLLTYGVIMGVAFAAFDPKG